MPSVSATIHPDARDGTGRERRWTLQKAVFEARERLASSTGTRASYDLGLLTEYAKARVSGAPATALMILILAALSSLWVPAHSAALWALAVLCANLGVALACRHFLKRRARGFDARRWSANFVALELVYGLSWATLALLAQANSVRDLAVIVFAMLLVGMAANAIATRSLRAATFASTAPAAIAVSVTLIGLGGTLNFALAGVVVGAELFFIYLSRQLHASELARLEHQGEKDALINELEAARNMSDEARRHAEQSNVAKSRFLATMSHELRTPLNAIIGFSEVLHSELLGPHQVPQYKEYAGDIHASGQHLLNLINELLDLSRIEAGKYELNEEPVQLVAIAEDSRRMLEIRARQKGLELVASYGDNLPKLWGDERAIRQVVLNLLSNAIKFTPKGGRVTLTVTRSGDGGQLVSVRDTGPGIPENEMEIVLSSFGQGSLAQKTAEQGAGLGLPIVQNIMELHQGRFDLFSKLRFGTEAIATFPRARVMDALAPVKEKPNRLRIYSDAS